MPLTRLELEEREVGRWVAEIELPGIATKFKTLTATSFADIWEAVRDAYYAERQQERPQEHRLPIAPADVIPDAEIIAAANEPRPHDREHGYVWGPANPTYPPGASIEVVGEDVPLDAPPLRIRKGWPKGKPRKPKSDEPQPPADD